ncbi:cation transporter [Spirosoma sp. 209]|uniref:cation transporter n=1 Tax=Spirosoma sp. 209 TaxID=1955701 RepID=UPI00098D1545|nr:cation transporter [Spirosoma sp. 209]
MNKSIFQVAGMDCPSEEQLIRMKLADKQDVERLQFDIPNRKVTVLHNGDAEPITRALAELRLDSRLLETEDADLAELTEEVPSVDSPRDRRLLLTVLAINGFFFTLEVLAGILADSMGLIADSLDMLADALVYGLALYAVSKAVRAQKKVARISGYLQLILAAGGLVEVVRRFITGEALPDFGLMVVVSLLALIGNSICLYLLRREKSDKAHMQASEIFTSNDIVVNLGVILAGGLVYLTHSPYPDLLIGLAIFVVVARGAFRIFQLAR